MKRIAATLALALAMLTGFAKEASANDGFTSTPASDSRITWVGRVEINQNCVSFDWTGVYARIRFEGQYLAMTVSDTKKNYYNVWLDSTTDKAPDKVISTSGTDEFVELFNKEEILAKYGKKGPKEHSVILQKRTEGEQGKTTVKNFYTLSGCNILQAEPLKARQIEFVGDSYTCGYGTEGASAKEKFRPETENMNLAYESIICRYFDADFFVVAHSGMGIARNYNDKFKDWYMPDRYLQTFDEEKESRWDASKSEFKPAMTVILLGANDFSVSRQPQLPVFKRQYIKLLKEIKANYGEDHPILCCSPKGAPDVFAYLKAAVEECGLKNVSYMGFFGQVFGSDDFGSDYHPNYMGHRKYAHSIIPYISTIAGWPISDEIR